MIPKTLHYCWFGGKPLPPPALKCVKSWHKFCPDFEIKRWDESNIDVSGNQFAAWCLSNGKWAFLSDWARLMIIEKHGGIYLDVDVEVVKPLAPLLSHKAFFAFETPDFIATGLGFGAEPCHPAVRAMLEEYENLTPDSDGSFPLVACPHANTRALARFGFFPNGKKQEFPDFIAYPPAFFNPFDALTGRLNLTADTFSIHWYSQSWLPWNVKARNRLMRLIRRLLNLS